MGKWANAILWTIPAYLLLLSASAKVLAPEPTPKSSWLGLAGLEMCIGMGLAVFGRQRSVRALAMLVFSGFAGYSYFRWIGGSESCGCFGSLKTSPQFSFFLDIVLVLMLAFSFTRTKFTRLRFACSLTIAAIPLVLFLNPHFVANGNRELRAYDLRTQEIDSKFAFSQVFDAPSFLLADDCELLFIDSNCDACEEAIRNFADRLDSIGNSQSAVAVYDVNTSDYLLSYPSTGIRWNSVRFIYRSRVQFVGYPIVYRMRDGAVIDVISLRPRSAGLFLAKEG